MSYRKNRLLIKIYEKQKFLFLSWYKCVDKFQIIERRRQARDKVEYIASMIYRKSLENAYIPILERNYWKNRNCYISKFKEMKGDIEVKTVIRIKPL